MAGGELIIGSSADEVNLATDPSYPCCTFRGNVVALDPATGRVLWNTYTVPDNGGVPCASDSPPAGCGYSGASVWGQPAVDAADGLVCVGTGNNYTAPDSAVVCVEAAGAAGASVAGFSKSLIMRPVNKPRMRANSSALNSPRSYNLRKWPSWSLDSDWLC